MKKIPSLFTVALSLALTFTCLAQTEHAFVWDKVNGMQDLGTLGGNNSYAFGINDHGVVAGYSYLADNVTFHAFRWTPTTGMVDIGATLPNGLTSVGAGINASDNIVATVFQSDGSAIPSIFHSPHSWKHLTDVGTLNRGYGMNDRNQVTGQVESGTFRVGYLWTPQSGAITYIPTLPGAGATTGVAVNNLGHVAGTAEAVNQVYYAIFWTADDGTRLIGSVNDSFFTAGGAINDKDEMVGYTLPELYGFYWTDATGIVALQSLGGSVAAAFGINRSGIIAGYGGLPNGTVHAVFWKNYTSSPTDLGTLGGTNSYAKALNNVGQVVGYSDMP